MTKQLKPIIHARDHEPGGADPIEGLLPEPGENIEDMILALPGLDAFWKLNEPSGVIAHDSSGNEHHLEATGAYIPPVWGQPAGPPEETSAHWGTDLTRVSSSALEPLTGFVDNFGAGVFVNMLSAAAGELLGQDQGGYHGGGSGGWALVTVTAGSDIKFAAAVDGEILYANNPVELGTWYLVALTRDDGTWKLFVNGLLQASTIDTDPGAVSGDNTWIGNDAFLSHGTFLQDGNLSYAFIADSVLTSSQLIPIFEGSVGEEVGEVLTIDADGDPSWQPPGVQVEHGGGEPDETETPASNTFLGGPETASGWHIEAHTETAVLYDSTPARFDVPSRQWVRVPFNTVRISRTWEISVDSAVVTTKWLPDDRGLTDQAKNGVLHVTSEMEEAQYTDGWFAPEYEMLDWMQLQNLLDDPDDPLPPPDDPDRYTRAARIVNLSTGQVMRSPPGSVYRTFFEWGFQFSADAGAHQEYVAADNPYPLWRADPARLLTRPQPYPRFSKAESVEFYSTAGGAPGFGPGSFAAFTEYTAGANLCLQAWQDSPWLLRFSTDHYPYYRGLLSTTYRYRPYLAVSYQYDPDSIDHATGLLL